MVLFKGLPPPSRKVNKGNKSSLSNTYPIKNADALLSDKDIQEFIKIMKPLIVPASRFSSFYLPVIKKFAEFVQSLPENRQGFFSQETGFLAHGLERASRTLSLCLSHFFPEKNSFSAVSDHEALWIYATFTAALLLDIGKLAVKYTITLYQEKGCRPQKWDPYTAAMLGQGDYYQFEYVKENFNDLRNFITPLLARQLLDSVIHSSLEMSGFNWIASDPKVLEVWFALLSGEEERIPMTSFMSMIPRAGIEIIDHHRKSAQIAITNPAGEAFLQWLRKELAEGRMLINEKNAVLQLTEKEILLSSVLFQAFANANPSYKHPEIIERQFIDIAKLYQIPISELDQRYRMQGGLSGLSDLGKRYRTVGGLSSVQENEKTASHRFLKGDIRLISLVISQPLIHTINNMHLPEKNTIKPSIFPNSST